MTRSYLGIDWSSVAKSRGYAVVADGQLVYVDRKPPAIQADWAVGERPWLKTRAGGKRATSTESLITMGVYAGYLLGVSGAQRTALVPVKLWKDLVMPRRANVSGDVFINLLRRKYALQDTLTEHEVDAVGIAHAAALLGDALDEYEVK